MRLGIVSLAAVAVLSLGLAACSFVTSAEAAVPLAAMASAVDPTGAALTLASIAGGVTASPSLQATEDFSAKGATAPRVSLDDMKAKIAGEYYFSALDGIDGHYRGGPEAQGCMHARELGLLTICILVMQNGFTVIGKSAPASPENCDADKGRTFAFEDAIRQLWPLEGYALRERLSQAA
jgi:hypothetical protein